MEGEHELSRDYLASLVADVYHYISANPKVLKQKGKAADPSRIAEPTIMRVYEGMKGLPPMPMLKLALTLGETYDIVRWALARLDEQGLVIKHGGKKNRTWERREPSG